jgi:hypothetical protein
MSASQDQSVLNSARGAGTSFGPNDQYSSSKATPAQSVGSATAYGHGQHPNDHSDGRDSNATLPGSRIGPQREDLDGEQMRAPGEGEVMDAQLNKKNAGWGEQDSLASDLDRKKAEQKSAREDIKAERQSGADVDGGAGNRLQNEGLGAV